MKTPEEKAAAKAAAKAKRDAAKAGASAAADAAQGEAVEQAPEAAAAPSVPAWKTLETEGVFVERPRTEKATFMGNHLATQPTVQTIIPLSDDEALGGSFAVCQINGFKMFVLKGTAVTLPQQIATHLNDEYINLKKATRSVPVRNPITGELVNMNLSERPQSDLARLGN